MTTTVPHIVIIGGGFAGLYTARQLRRTRARITLLDRTNHHLFQPLLYQVATAGLSAPDIATPIRQVLRKQKNITVVLAEVSRVNPGEKNLTLDDGEVVDFDYCVVATGMVSSYFGNDHWRKNAPGLKDLHDAMDVRRRVLFAFEAAEREHDPGERSKYLNFVVIGGGPTGVEMAGALAEIARKTMVRDFRRFNPQQTRVTLIEAGPRILGTFSEKISDSAREKLFDLGVDVRTDTRVTDIGPERVDLSTGYIDARTVIWAAGVRASPLTETLGAPLDRSGRVLVTPSLTLPEHSHVYVIGDIAAVESEGKPVPGIAPAAIQQGKHAAINLRHALADEPLEPFKYFDKGAMAAIGRRSAVAAIGDREFTGFTAWFLWVVIHVMFLINFRNRLVVMMEWIWAYFTYQHGSRIVWKAPEEFSPPPPKLAAGEAKIDDAHETPEITPESRHRPDHT